MSNPYQPPSANSTLLISKRSTPISWIAIFVVYALVASLSHGKPLITVIAIAIVGATTLPFLSATVRRKCVWGFVFGLVLAIILPPVFLSIMLERPNTYDAMHAYSARAKTILAFTLPIGAWFGAFASLWLPNKTAEIG